MRVLHVQVEYDDGWLIAQGLEDRSVITQGRTLDEIVQNVREVLELLNGSKGVQIELILPPGALGGRGKGRRGLQKQQIRRRRRLLSQA